MKLSERIHKILENNADYIISTLLCGFAMFLFCHFSMAQFEANSTLITGDSMELYIPGLRALVRNILNGEGLSYSFDLSMGMNAIEYYSAVVGGSFVNIIYLLFHNMSMDTFILIALVLKSAVVGFCFTYFSRKVLKVKGYVNVFFSLFYALCGFQVSINSVNYIWMDMVYMLPLLLALIVAAIDENKWLRLCLAYAYLFVCNFYIAYIVGFFTAIYFMFTLWLRTSQTVKGKFIIMVKYAVFVLLGAGLVAWSLIPTAHYMLNDYQMQTSNYHTDIIGRNILIYIQRLTFGNIWNDSIHYPYIYCGIPCILLLPFYILDRNVDRKEKIIHLILLGIMFLSCVILPIYIFWHGFDEPDMWYYRFGFIISFLLVAMACKEFGNIAKISLKKVLVVIVPFTAVLTIAVNYGLNNGLSSDRKIVLYNLGLILIWTVLGFSIQLLQGQGKRLLALLAFAVALVELVANGSIGHQIYQSESEYHIWEKETASSLELLREDSSFYRVNYENDLVFNSDTYWGYRGIGDFASFENVQLRNTLQKLGAYTSTRVTLGYGLNPLTQMILAVKYDIHGSGSYFEETAGASVSQYGRVLNLGFLVDDQIKDLTLGDQDVFDNCNRLASAMLGKEIAVFTEIPEEEITIEESGITYGKSGDICYFNADLSDDLTKYISFIVPYDGNEAYMAIGDYNQGIRSEMPQIFEPSKRRDVGCYGVRYTKKLDYAGEAQYFQVGMRRGMTNDYVEFAKLRMCYAQENVLNELYAELGSSQIQVHDVKNGDITATVEATADKRILFTSVPYDQGWKIVSPQSDIKIVPLVEGAFLGIEFPGEGTYELHLQYEAAGLKQGIIVFCISLAILLGIAGTKALHFKK